MFRSFGAARVAPFVVAGVAPLFLGGCFVRDTDALYEKIYRQCGVEPVAPACIDHETLSAPDTRRAWDLFLDAVESDLEQSCVLEVDCADQDEVVVSIIRCLNLEEPRPLPWEPPYRGPGLINSEQEACLGGCHDHYLAPNDACGDPNATCSAALVDTCLEQATSCQELCLAD